MSTQIVERPSQQRPGQSQVIIFRDQLITRQEELATALEGTGISVKRFVRAAVTAHQVDPELFKCSFQSRWLALLEACRDQLLPDRRQGVIYGYNGEAKWVPMVWGLIGRCQKHPDFKWLTVDHHREDDRQYDIWVDEHGQHFIHKPGPREGKIISTYAAGLMKTGAFYVVEITEPHMAAIRAMSKARRDDSPWFKWPDQMRQKSALKRLAKLLPLPPEIEELMARDDEESPPIAPEIEPTPLPRPRGTAEALDTFAGEHGTEAHSTTRGEPEPELTSGGAGIDEGHGAGAPQSDTEPPLEAEGGKVSRVLLETAHERGRQARAEGTQKRAMPPEYRDAARGQEAVAWRKGWDGEPLDGGAS